MVEDVDGLAETQGADADMASPRADPSPCLEPVLPAQAVIRVSASYMGCKCIHGLPLHHMLMMFTITHDLEDRVNITICSLSL